MGGYDKGLFFARVPLRLQHILIFLMLFPLLGVGGVYTANLVDVYSSLGTLSEILSFSTNAGIIGMMVSFSLIFKVKGFFRTKEILVGGFLVLAMLSMAISKIENPYLLVLLSFLMGFVRMSAMIELVLPLMGILSPKGDRGEFYVVFYPYVIIGAQVSSIVAAYVTYQINWSAVHVFMGIILLICALICIVLLHNKRPSRQIPFNNIDYISISFFLVMLMLLNYILVYAKQQDWFNSENIQYATIGFLVCLIVFVGRQLSLRNPYVNISIFSKRSVVTGLLLIFLMGIYTASSSLQGGLTSVLSYDSPTNTLINASIIPGVIAGGLFSNWWFRQNWSMKYLLFVAYFSFLLYAMTMYFMVSPVMAIEYLILVQFFKGLGMALVYIGGTFYFASKLTTPEMISMLGIMIGVRSFLGSAFFAALLSWMQYYFQWENFSMLAGLMDGSDAIISSRGSGVMLYTPVQTQALLVTQKEVFGYISIAGVLILIYIVLHPFERMHHRRYILYRQNLYRFGAFKKR